MPITTTVTPHCRLPNTPLGRTRAFVSRLGQPFVAGLPVCLASALPLRRHTIVSGEYSNVASLVVPCTPSVSKTVFMSGRMTAVVYKRQSLPGSGVFYSALRLRDVVSTSR